MHGGGWRHHRASGHSSHTGRHNRSIYSVSNHDTIWLPIFLTILGFFCPPLTRTLPLWAGSGEGGIVFGSLAPLPRSVPPSRGGLGRRRHLFVPPGTGPSLWNGRRPAGHLFVHPPTLVRIVISPSPRRGDLFPEKYYVRGFLNSQPNMISCVLDLGFRDFERFQDKQIKRTNKVL